MTALGFRYQLPFLVSDAFYRTDRDRRREMAILAEHHASKETLGAAFSSVTVAELCPDGDPEVLDFQYDGPADERAIEIFMGRFKRQFPRRDRELFVRRTAVIRPLEMFWPDDRRADELWKQRVLPAIVRRASRATLGARFLEVDDNAAMDGEDIVVFAFADYEFQNNGAIVDAFAQAMRIGSN